MIKLQQKEFIIIYYFRVRSTQTTDISMKSYYSKYNNFWLNSETCLQEKQCDIYPPVRVLHKSINKEFTCDNILNKLLEPIYKCIIDNGKKKCKLVLDAGFYRSVYLVNYFDNKQYVLKIMKPSSLNKSRDILRHIREAILLYYLKKFEFIYIDGINQKKVDLMLEEKKELNIESIDFDKIIKDEKIFKICKKEAKMVTQM